MIRECPAPLGPHQPCVGAGVSHAVVFPVVSSPSGIVWGNLECVLSFLFPILGHLASASSGGCLALLGASVGMCPLLLLGHWQ